MLYIFKTFETFSSSLIHVRALVAALGLAACFIAAQNTSAATFTVTRSDDRNATCSSGVDCSLREAVKAANAAAGGDVIEFAPGLTLITLASGDAGDIKIFNPAGLLLINGPGANILTIDGGAGTNRIFELVSATVTIYGVTIQGGNGNSGTSGNPDGYGGAIAASSSSLTLNTVVLRNNGGAALGGGALYLFDGAHRIINSTISDNQSRQCGGFAFNTSSNSNPANNLSIVNSTVSGNSATGSSPAGAGFCNEGTTSIRNSTVTNNTATVGDGGGISNFSIMHIGNTIIAGNNSAGMPEIQNTGTVNSAGNNLIGDAAGDSTNTQNPITFQASDIRDTPPLLGALQNNGGATPTHALFAGSPGIDKGSNTLAVDPFNNATLLTDQRGNGFTRSADGNGDTFPIVDIGAFEVQTPIGTTAATVSISGRVTDSNGDAIESAKITMTDSQGNARPTSTTFSGEYKFDDCQVGETYIVSVSDSHYSFVQPSQVLSVNDEASEINFIALPTSKSRKRVRLF